ncbi:multifunctional CCA tRNA nucleotidyl transferase/2'3'-cyclic phosphodiesterase/2'nucleotidase/phosphatase [Massilia puerhi]|uniref:multifunctional CCA tRNA nucleotidyl transferase/2'3'-cyclic phosphodiesterase/2'nucleotidase/phosphatase n=1 Tax=Massilia puerhi TaxID=2681550 RepID=UPI00135C0F51|nr:multifunctional CCA tRNA nucleotidyl transferase/2'3'-cyclic phosphodiesterase/2'nucleotidase/phosphatase [Massilia puerhi]
MRSYVVGGAVRDALLGLPVKDHDHVVVGATPEQMLEAGFRAVGRDFPVFLHPRTHEEYALARTERKTAPGYHGFVFHAAPDVTLEQDLVRRDLTINAMAQAEDGSIVDPHNGRQDLAARLFRHVSDAFAEDPVRILRIARFAARLSEFTVAPETNALMRRMVEAGEVDALVPERVWQELARGLMEDKPSRMLAVLRDCGALAQLLPELPALDTPTGASLLRALDRATTPDHPLEVRFAVLMRYLDGVDAIQAVCKRLKVPNECRDLAVMTARERDALRQAAALPAEAIVTLFERSDAFRKPERFGRMLLAAECTATLLAHALDAARAVNAGEIAARHADHKHQIPIAVHQARVEAVTLLLHQTN